VDKLGINLSPQMPLDPTTHPHTLTVRILCQELHANAPSVESKLGGVDHRHLRLGMIMPEHKYIHITTDVEPYKYPKKPVVAA
jgi:hypothetical protein